MATYTFQNAEGTMARRVEGNTTTSMPWDAQIGAPVNAQDHEQWVLDDQPTPSAYVPPPPPPPSLSLAWSDQYKALAGSQTGTGGTIGLAAWDRNNPSSAFHIYIAKVNAQNTDITSIFLPAIARGGVLRVEDRRNPTTRYVEHTIMNKTVRTDDIEIQIQQKTAVAMPFFDGQLLNVVIFAP